MGGKPSDGSEAWQPQQLYLSSRSGKPQLKHSWFSHEGGKRPDCGAAWRMQQVKRAAVRSRSSKTTAGFAPRGGKRKQAAHRMNDGGAQEPDTAQGLPAILRKGVNARYCSKLEQIIAAKTVMHNNVAFDLRDSKVQLGSRIDLSAVSRGR